MHFVRCGVAHARIGSGVAHARIRSIDVSAALQTPGVIAAFTGADLPVPAPPMAA